jgi:hypothetical protein
MQFWDSALHMQADAAASAVSRARTSMKRTPGALSSLFDRAYGRHEMPEQILNAVLESRGRGGAARA